MDYQDSTYDDYPHYLDTPLGATDYVALIFGCLSCGVCVAILVAILKEASLRAAARERLIVAAMTAFLLTQVLSMWEIIGRSGSIPSVNNVPSLCAVLPVLQRGAYHTSIMLLLVLAANSLHVLRVVKSDGMSPRAALICAVCFGVAPTVCNAIIIHAIDEGAALRVAGSHTLCLFVTFSMTHVLTLYTMYLPEGLSSLLLLVLIIVYLSLRRSEAGLKQDKLLAGGGIIICVTALGLMVLENYMLYQSLAFTPLTLYLLLAPENIRASLFCKKENPEGKPLIES